MFWPLKPADILVAAAVAAIALSGPGRRFLYAAVEPTFPFNAVTVSTSANPVCPWRQAVEGLQESGRVRRALRRLQEESRLVRSDEQGFQLWQSPSGSFWFPPGGSGTSVRFALAQYQQAAYPGLEIRAGDVVMDCGGFVGDWAHWVLQRGASRIIVVEPVAEHVECIRRNLGGAIQDGRVVIIAKGVWDRDELRKLSRWEENPAAHSVVDQRQTDGETIELTTVDAIVQKLQLERLDVLKMDIEGAETRAVRGAEGTLRRFRPRLAIATEHTVDVIQNNRNVIAEVAKVAPFYSWRCGYCVLDEKRQVVPETLYFDPR